ncbi:MAG: hypothetical protein ACRBBW_02100 [Cellvibrionaceae bacterium]
MTKSYDLIVSRQLFFSRFLSVAIVIVATLFTAVLSTTVLAQTHSSKSELLLGCTAPKGSAMLLAVERVYRAALHNVGVQLTMIPMPNLREQAALVAGEIDGVCGRIKRFDQLSKQSELQRLSVAIAYSEVSAFSPQPLTHLMDEKQPRILSYNLGELSVQRILPALRHHDLKPAPTAEKAAHWLEENKVHIYVGDDIHFETAWRRAGISQELYRKVIYTDEYYMFLSAKYSKDFIRRLSNSVKQQLDLNGGALDFREVFAGKQIQVKYIHEP